MIRSVLVGLAVLLTSAQQLPAPISEPTPEETKAKPQAAPAKHKSVESSDSNSARRFDGTWKGTRVDKTVGAVYTTSATLIIKDGKTADANTEVTSTLQDPRGWGFLPEAYKHLSPLFYKYSNHSDHLVAAGLDLMTRWSGRRLIDWAPKTLPLEEAQRLARSNEVSLAAFTLKGDELVFGNGQFVFHRVK
jgi:hypothetical protein